MKQNGFTLIELLVVISIIGLLASVVLVSLNGARVKARMARLSADMHQIQTQIDIARDLNSALLGQTTGSWCTCSVNDVSWRRLGFAKNPVDPWGRPYILDENEQEFNSTDCRYDMVYSPGPNGVWEGFGTQVIPGQITIGSGDDYEFAITHWVCPN